MRAHEARVHTLLELELVLRLRRGVRAREARVHTRAYSIAVHLRTGYDRAVFVWVADCVLL